MIQGVNTSRNRKRQPKMTKANIAKWTEEHRVYNKQMKQSGQPKVTLEQYIDIIHGLTPKKRNNTYDTFKEHKPTQGYRRAGTDHIPSYVGTGHSTGRVSSPQYTGTLIKGIGTMHKSNAVPVIDEQQMKDLASMRR